MKKHTILFCCLQKKIEAQPYAMPQMLVGLDFAINTPKQIVISGNKKTEEVHYMLKEVYSRFIPGKILINLDESNNSELLKLWSMYKASKPTAFVCENFTCKLPVNTSEELEKLLTNNT